MTNRDQLKAIQDELRAKGVRYCIGAYVDIHGVPKGKVVPIDHFDDALLTHIHADPRPMTAVIADTMSDHRFQVGDWMLQQRIITLIAATKVVAVGDPSIARSCLIRRAQ